MKHTGSFIAAALTLCLLTSGCARDSRQTAAEMPPESVYIVDGTSSDASASSSLPSGDLSSSKESSQQNRSSAVSKASKADVPPASSPESSQPESSQPESETAEYEDEYSEPEYSQPDTAFYERKVPLRLTPPPEESSAPASVPDSDTQSSAAEPEPEAPKPKKVSSEAQKMIDGVLRRGSYASAASLDVEAMEQYPELPTGCESVSLTMLLNYLGCGLGLTDIADDYLVYGDSYVYSYLGDPREDDGAGIFPPGIVSTVENYANAKNKKLEAVDLTGRTTEELYRLIEYGCPIMIWGTIYLEEPRFDPDLGEIYEEYNGIEYPFFINEHCFLLTGYDKTNGTITLTDPIFGIIDFDMDQFEYIYNETGKFSLTVIDKSKPLVSVVTKTETSSKPQSSTAQASKTENSVVQTSKPQSSAAQTSKTDSSAVQTSKPQSSAVQTSKPQSSVMQTSRT